MSNTLIPAAESYGACVAEAAILNAMHWLEYSGKSGYRADHGGVVDLEKAGGFAYFTLRDEQGVLAGHAGFHIIRSPFYGNVVALDVFYYIKPEYRGAFGMAKLLRFAAENLTARGVDQVVASNKVEHNLSSIIKRAGFKKSGDMYFYRKD